MPSSRGWPSADAVDLVARAERATVLATVARDVRDVELAEDAVQEALLAAARQWPEQGVPARPGAWLTTVARRAALRALQRPDRQASDPAVLEAVATWDADGAASPIPDAQLELLFACCHPALRLDAQVALTLRTVAGLTTPQIARAFLVPEATLAQRLVRAQRKIRDSGIPFAVPDAGRMADRLAGVLAVIYLIFNEGYAATSGPPGMRIDLCDEAIALARLVATLLPDEPEALGLAALVLVHDARRAARVDAEGTMVPLVAQDRTRYDRARIAEGERLLERALAIRRSGPYQVQAAIAMLHATAATPGDTDWPQIAALYGALDAMAPSPLVTLSRATAVSMAAGPAAGLALLEDLTGLEDHVVFHATRADLLTRAGQHGEADRAYARALALVPPGGSEHADLLRRRADARSGG